MFDQYTLAGKDIRGLALVGTVLFMAESGGTMIGTALPENTGVELTTVGNYVTDLSASVVTGTFSDTASYSLVRNTNVAVELTSPLPNFVATSTGATIAGRISDPSITTVSVGIQLPFTEFLNDPVLTDGSSTGLWSTAVEQGGGSVSWFIASGAGCPACGEVAWRFGKPGEKSFAEGESQVSGTLSSNADFPITAGSTLEFNTAWETEFGTGADIKVVQCRPSAIMGHVRGVENPRV